MTESTLDREQIILNFYATWHSLKMCKQKLAEKNR